MREELFKGLTDEQISKVKGCKTQEEMLAVAKEEGIELTDEQLEAVNGGVCTNFSQCPKCQSTNITIDSILGGAKYECHNCGYTWKNYLF